MTLYHQYSQEMNTFVEQASFPNYRKSGRVCECYEFVLQDMQV